MNKYIILFFILFSVSCTTDKVCRNPQGEAVDWYAIFFMPDSVSPDKKINYGYFDPNLPDLQFYEYSEDNFPPTMITKYVTEAGSNINFNYFFWNDDKSRKGGNKSSASESKAHAKGSLVYDEDDGVFLLHSLPKYPTRDINNNVLNELPSNAGSNGQTFLCISVERKIAEQIAKLLNCINVSVNKSIDSDKVSKSPNQWVNGLIKNRMDKSCSISHTVKIKSKGNEEFTFFGKNYKKIVIPYDTELREAYQDNVFVRTWSRPALAPALFDKYFLANVYEIKIGQYKYGVNTEHAKWAVTETQEIVCFSDLNHTFSQDNRGGHIVCFKNKILHNIMKAAIIDSDIKRKNKNNNDAMDIDPNPNDSDDSMDIDQQHLVDLFRRKLNNVL